MFSYNPTKEELEAEKLLKNNGWAITQPKCSLCRGRGTVGKIKTDGTTTYSWVTILCPNGCPTVPTYYFY